MANKCKHLIIDGSNLFYRGYYIGNMVDKDGKKVNGIFNFMKMLNLLLVKFRPQYCIITWDLGKSRARYSIYPEYKAGRRSSLTKKQLENISWQVGTIKFVLKALPVKQVEVMDVEADDIMGYLSKKTKGSKIIVSNDHDLLQLVSKDTSVYIPKTAKVVSDKNIESFLGIPRDRYVLYKAIVGDSSDNIKGINKMGPVKTKQLLSGDEVVLNTEWDEIIKRNLDLMDIGKLINKEEILQIRKVYMAEKKKEINPLLPRRIFTNLRFRSIVTRYNQWILPFKKLRT